VATILGVVSPLGSYAVIPIFAVLISSGIPLAPIMAFLIASPLMSPIDFISTWGMLGVDMALVRVISAILIGVGFGSLVHYLGKRDLLFGTNPDIKGNVGTVKTSLMSFVDPTASESFLKRLRYSIMKTSKYTAKYFFLALILSGITNTLIPQDWIVRTLGGSSYSILLASAMSLPLYMCGGGAVILVMQLLLMGMDQGAALAFFIAGPATRIGPMVTVLALVKQRAFFLYFAMSFGSAILFGYIYRWLNPLYKTFP